MPSRISVNTCTKQNKPWEITGILPGQNALSSEQFTPYKKPHRLSE